MSEKTGYVRVAAAVPHVKPADTVYNSKEIIKIINDADAAGIGCIVFPELCITGASCGDLFYQNTLYRSQMKALSEIAEAASETKIIVVLGVYVRAGNCMYNGYAVLQGGEIHGIVPKNSVPDRNTKQDTPQFVPYAMAGSDIDYVMVNGEDVLFGNIIFDDEQSGISFAVCSGDDLASPGGLCGKLSASGALIVFCPDAVPASAGKFSKVISMATAASEQNKCAVCFASAGCGESTSDFVYGGYALIAENGELLGTNVPLENSTNVIYTEIDTDYLKYERAQDRNFCGLVKDDICIDHVEIEEVPQISFDTEEKITRTYKRLPFLEPNPGETFVIQSMGLARRLESAHAEKSVIGISGGLDSTLALLVAVNAHKTLKRPVSDVIAVTMPGFGTTGMTYSNAMELMKLLGVTVREISISESVRKHFKDIGQDEDNHDVTYENSQARERTQILMDIANMENGIVVGTGDLSEMALGWCTYNGDHMSMYAVNAGVPKTQVRDTVGWFVENILSGFNSEENFSSDNEKLAQVLTAILSTPVSPELLPPDADGNIAQITEEKVGPYDLNDFFIYYTVKYGMSPSKLYNAACSVFDDMRPDEIKGWLKIFYRRFFTQQFKRSCSPDGPKVGPLSLSPRGSWNMPSDVAYAVWAEEADRL